MNYNTDEAHECAKAWGKAFTPYAYTEEDHRDGFTYKTDGAVTQIFYPPVLYRDVLSELAYHNGITWGILDEKPFLKIKTVNTEIIFNNKCIKNPVIGIFYEDMPEFAAELRRQKHWVQALPDNWRLINPEM